MKKEVKTKKITIDKLAILVKNGFDSVDKKLEQHDKVFTSVLKELRTAHEDNKFFRENISSLNTDGLSYDKRINNLTVRVEKLETDSK